MTCWGCLMLGLYAMFMCANNFLLHEYGKDAVVGDVSSWSWICLLVIAFCMDLLNVYRFLCDKL